MATLTGYEVVLPMVLICISIKLNIGFPGNSDGKESACDAGGPDLIPGLGRSAGEEIGLHVCGIQKNGTDEPGKAEIETQT